MVAVTHQPYGGGSHPNGRPRLRFAWDLRLRPFSKRSELVLHQLGYSVLIADPLHVLGQESVKHVGGNWLFRNDFSHGSEGACTYPFTKQKRSSAQGRPLKEFSEDVPRFAQGPLPQTHRPTVPVEMQNQVDHLTKRAAGIANRVLEQSKKSVRP